MYALVFDKSRAAWEKSTGFEKVEVPTPTLDEKRAQVDATSVIIKVRYAGVCGTDRSLWYRQAFGEQIRVSLLEEGKTWRVIGHEFFGDIAAVGSQVKDFKKGDTVACESHVVCNACFQCRHGQNNVCVNEKILGISHDGGFAEYVKVPAHIVRHTDITKIRPEIAAMQEPFGNAVHAASKVDLKGKTVAIFGFGPIGSFLALVVRGMGAKSVIGVEPKKVARDMGRELGVDVLIEAPAQKDRSDYRHDPDITRQIMDATDGRGADVAFDMAGYSKAVNNAIFSTRRGGDVILFGFKSGDFVFEDYNRLVMKGITLYAVAGRQIWRSWDITQKLLSDKTNGIQDKLFNVILRGGKGTILPFADYTKEKFEAMMAKNPKIMLKF